jgi:hypothetical protein
VNSKFRDIEPETYLLDVVAANIFDKLLQLSHSFLRLSLPFPSPAQQGPIQLDDAPDTAAWYGRGGKGPTTTPSPLRPTPMLELAALCHLAGTAVRVCSPTPYIRFLASRGASPE